jgi:hypothetical protein
MHRRIDLLPDHRKKGLNTTYRIQDAALGAFGIFFPQSLPFLDYQGVLQQTKSHNNVRTLLGMATPSYIVPQDGHVKQDFGRVAGKRWVATHTAWGAPWHHLPGR